jgi:penicillin-binding protein 1C
MGVKGIWRSWRKGKALRWGALAALFLSLAAWVRCGPLPEGFTDPAPHRSVRVLDRRGRLLYESLSERESRSAWLGPGSLPPVLVQATLAAEDHRFLHHPGVDPLALVRAALTDLRALRFKEGGSTLTQQAVKQLMGRRRTVSGKLKEMVYALRLEHRLSKQEVLALYLNLAPYGNQYEGAQAASLGYFGCPAANLTAAQAAFLAGLPQRPSALDPYKNLKGALARQREVLRRMRDLGTLDRADYDRALSERLVFKAGARPLTAPHFVEAVLADLPAGAAGEVRTTLDADLQRQIEGVIAAHRADLDRHGAHNVALAVLDNATGQWLAWEGSGSYFEPGSGGAIDGVTSPRQPGSALKPFTYALAFERGFTPASALPDIPSHFPTAEPGILYSPRNYDGAFRGPLRARLALAGSENVPAVWLLSQLGVPQLLERLRSLGFGNLDRSADYYGFGLTLGDTEVRLADLCAAYATLARGGRYLRPTALLGPEGGMPSSREGPAIISPQAAFWVTDILSDNEARAFIFGRGGSLEFPFEVAAKTGTSQAYRDNWTVGYTREVTVGVWVGNFDGTPMKNSSGVTGAGPIFHDAMLAAERFSLGRLPGPADPPILSVPEGLVEVTICTTSGDKAGEACPSTAREWLRASAPPSICRWHLREGGTLRTFYPPEYRSWAAARGGSSREASATSGPSGGRSRGLAIESPPDGATYWIDPTLREEYQALELTVAGSGAGDLIRWRLDGKPLGASPAGRPLRWPLRRGEHTLEAEDPRGGRARASFVVR